MKSDIQHRGEAVIDPLTGMFNRNALANRTSRNRQQQSTITGDPVPVILGDLDRFKTSTTARPRRRRRRAQGRRGMRAQQASRFDLAYRLAARNSSSSSAGATANQVGAITEQLRVAIEAQPLSGLEVTMSFGVSASERGTDFEFDSVLAQADEALYEAKRSGRNRVCVLRPARTDVMPVAV